MPSFSCLKGTLDGIPFDPERYRQRERLEGLLDDPRNRAAAEEAVSQSARRGGLTPPAPPHGPPER